MLESTTRVDFRYVIVIFSMMAFFYYSIKYDRQHKTHRTVNILFYGLWVIAIAFLFFVYSNIDIEKPEQTTIFTPLGMIIAAMLASLSVMKNIAETKANEETKHKKDDEKSLKEKERKRVFALNVMKTIQVTLNTFSKKAESKYHASIGLRSFRSPTDFDSDIQTTGKLLNSVFCESILPYLTDEEQTIISNFYSEYYRFLATYEHDESAPSLGVLTTKRHQKPLHQNLNIFSNFAQSYIDLNTQTDKEKNA